jgi:hypothetical protein
MVGLVQSIPHRFNIKNHTKTTKKNSNHLHDDF